MMESIFGIIDAGMRLGWYLFVLLNFVVMGFVVLKFLPRRSGRRKVNDVVITSLSKEHRGRVRLMEATVLDPKTFRKKKGDKDTKAPRVVAVIEFSGLRRKGKLDEMDRLSAVIDTILGYQSAAAAQHHPAVHKVILLLNSPGGPVHDYGYGTALLERLRKAGIDLVVCVDRVAASGGYMMAAVGSKVIATPFSIVGSVGVIMGFPNFSGVVDRLGAKYHMVTGGADKRRAKIFSPMDEGDLTALEEQVKSIHAQFLAHVKKYRPGINETIVSTANHWTAQEAQGYGLVDELATSAEVIGRHLETYEVVRVECKDEEPGLLRKLIREGVEAGITAFSDRFLHFLG